MTWTDVMDYGAVGDGIADDTTALNSAAVAAKTVKSILYFPPGKTFKVTATIVIEVDVFGVGSAIQTSSTSIVAVQLGTDTTYTMRKTAQMPRIECIGHAIGWSSESGIGLRVVRCFSCEVHIPRISNFATGLRLDALGDGCGYNSFFPSQLDNNKVNLHVKPGDSLGWVNQNSFFGGRFSHNTGAEGSNVSGCRQVLLEALGSRAPNNNVFFNVSLEGATPEYTVESIAGYRNYFYACRWEIAPRVSWNELNSTYVSYENVIELGFDAESIIETVSANSVRNVIWTRKSITLKNGNFPVTSLDLSASRVGSVIYDPPSLLKGTQATTTLTVPGAILGDTVLVSFSLDLTGIQLTGYVSAGDTVTCIFQNVTGSSVNLGSGTLKAIALRT